MMAIADHVDIDQVMAGLRRRPPRLAAETESASYDTDDES